MAAPGPITFEPHVKDDHQVTIKVKDVGEGQSILEILFATRSVRVVISNEYVYERKLPGDIVPEECRVEIKEGSLIIKLYKVNTNSWAPYASSLT